jgi:uncharacterized protein
MSSDHEIGRVVAVDTAQVTVELNRDLKALTRSTYEGTLEVGRINSYIIIPVGSRRIVAMVTRVLLTEESELKADKTMVLLPSSRRLMKATMIGTIDEGLFRQGISLFPVLDTPVLITTNEDLDAIFGKKVDFHVSTPDEPGFCIPIGRSAIFHDYEIKVDPDAFFGKHAAIIGSTGSGKSCSIATIVQSVIEQAAVKQTRFIILDTNGEYRAAFQKANNDGNWVDARPTFKSLYIPTDPSEVEKLTIPYWFMNSDDFVRLFRASPGVQRPVLLNALSSARNSSESPNKWVGLREKLIREINTIISFSRTREWSSPGNIEQMCLGAVEYVSRTDSNDSLDQLTEIFTSVSKDTIISSFNKAKNALGVKNNKGYFPSLNLQSEDSIISSLKSLLDLLSREPSSSVDSGLSIFTSDSPRFFSKQDFRYQHLDNAITGEESSSRARDNCSTMLMRIYRLLEDSRFEFLFGPTCAEWPFVNHSLATFMRDILGTACCPNIDHTNAGDCPSGQLPFYDRQRGGASRSNVVIIDLSLLASEVLENVTALIGRLIHEFLQRLSDPVSGLSRGEYPVVLILEEAQNYIREGRRTEEDSISKLVFERIAREGRKYGLGLVVASQRPSELSKTVLSQCNSFIVHRLQNPEDLRYFREIVPSIYGQMLDQLPALAPRSALVLGECVQAPALVEIREANPVPKSRNPKFYKSWTQDEKQPNFEAVCEKWEGRQPVCPTPSDQAIGISQNEDETE